MKYEIILRDGIAIGDIELSEEAFIKLRSCITNRLTVLLNLGSESILVNCRYILVVKQQTESNESVDLDA